MRVPEKCSPFLGLFPNFFWLIINFKMVGLDIPNLLGYHWCLGVVVGYFISQCGFVQILSTAVVNTSRWLVYTVDKSVWPNAGSFITSSAMLRRQCQSPQPFLQVQQGVRTWPDLTASTGELHFPRLKRNGSVVLPSFASIPKCFSGKLSTKH